LRDRPGNWLGAAAGGLHTKFKIIFSFALPLRRCAYFVIELPKGQFYVVMCGGAEGEKAADLVPHRVVVLLCRYNVVRLDEKEES
jgi:hypothetical protein